MDQNGKSTKDRHNSAYYKTRNTGLSEQRKTGRTTKHWQNNRNTRNSGIQSWLLKQYNSFTNRETYYKQ